MPDGGLEGPRAHDRRVVRGGVYICDERDVRCAARFRSNPNHRDRRVGFRAVLVLDPAEH
jgi:formylglycine-generating enzyme required for sulfatase activity